MNTQEIIQFFQSEPDFFKKNPELLIHLNLPQPEELGVLSLTDYQLKELRDTNRTLNEHYQKLLQNASINTDINDAILKLCVQLLSIKNDSQIPETLLKELEQSFDHLHVALRLWSLENLSHSDIFCVDENLQQWTETLEKPYLGTTPYLEITQWFTSSIQSYACIPLKHDEKSMGLLVFASQDKQHFTPDMDTYFLGLIRDICQATLSRLKNE
ncbi:DUF484 family protein [Basilea psittacipulmonis]|uniref:DUF484 domain-containing protein n=1 Tax=Basilea psittacipulmonis DSM 24701 TaxID=1072685 RepID=A0A077DD09_9BURK|nr:DUF484 family protein [Basilea psittacipulmonis]AIL32720.1 hypothetical protein IX83_04830 [Basilea psittacipulmonis DSM 24701]